MYLSIIFILFSIYTTCASPLPIDSSIGSISAISKRADAPEQAKSQDLINAWNAKSQELIAGKAKSTELTYRTKFLGEAVLIKGYILTPSSKAEKDFEQAKASAQLHVELQDFVAWGKVSNPTWNSAHCMVIIRDNDNYRPLSAAIKEFGRSQVASLKSDAISKLSKETNIPEKKFNGFNFVFLGAAPHYV